MDFGKLISRYKQFGGLRLLLLYAKLGVLPVVVKGFFYCLHKQLSFKFIYPEVLKRIEPYLIERFQVSDFKIQTNRLSHKHPKVIWWCWLQGKEHAPPVVQACFESLHRNFVQEIINLSDGYVIKVIDGDNWKEYIELPDYIVKKWDKKQIPPAMFSDLLRLQLLVKYGGTWIDSTVLCTGFKYSKAQEYKKYLDEDLFLFQYTPQGTTKDISISNWFISAHSNNVVLMVLRDMLFAYWKEYNCTLNYYIFHLFFAMVAEEFPEQIAAMPFGSSQNSTVLMRHLGKPFNPEQWEKLVSIVGFHKLSYRVPKEIYNNTNNYYNFIINDLRER